jgi:MarR family transcriptional regulator, organic hydroperoxide resistance regulator
MNLSTQEALGLSSKEQVKAPLLRDQLCFALYATSRAFTKTYASLLSDLGVTYPQYLVLLILWENDGLTIQQIANQLELEGATTTPLIKRMEKIGLVSRQRCSLDERRVLVHLTPRAESFRERASAIPEALGCAVGVSAETAGNLLNELNKIRSDI